ncbi:MAG: preprotein translocase subunit SecE [Actinobacteria bacterium]|nr:MAG: preprotein translocase subunit SecE [Actinomycetota bacterium]
MAESNRRGDDAANDRREDEAAADAVKEESTARGGTATQARRKTESDDKAKKDTERVGFFGRIARFVREVVAELRKVIWPTRKELLTYTAVVIAFVATVLTIVALLDYGFAKGVLLVFG